MGDFMGYRIVYEKKQAKKHRFLPLQAMIGVFLLLFAMYVRFAWPEGREAMRNLLVSQFLSQGAEAVVAMVDRLEGDCSVTDAIASFCQEIFHGG